MTTAPAADDQRDINDIFDEIISVEDHAEQEAYEQAHCAASTVGNTEGYHLGYHRGAELGAELGYYAGVACVYRQHLQPAADSKLDAALAAVENAALRMPTSNDADVDLFERVNKVRSLYKRLCALLKISGRYPEADTLSF